MTRYFDKNDILEIIYEGETGNGAHRVEEELIEMTRWDARYRVVFEFDGKFYAFEYNKGLTEVQENRPFEYEDEVECVEVEPKEVTVIKYLEKE